MKLMKTAILVAGAAFTLSGCSGISLAKKAAKFEEMYDEVTTMADTTGATMPTTGAATYSGSTMIGADFGGDDNVAMFGDADLTADFAAGSVNGTLSNFSGLILTDAEREAADNGNIDLMTLLKSAKSLKGDVAISNAGGISGTTFGTTAAGTLTVGGEEYTVAGAVDGQFKGDAASALYASEGAGFTVSRDGDAATGSTIEIVAEK